MMTELTADELSALHQLENDELDAIAEFVVNRLPADPEEFGGAGSTDQPGELADDGTPAGGHSLRLDQPAAEL